MTISQQTPDGLGNSSRLLKDLLESANNLPRADHADLGLIQLTLNQLQQKTLLLRKHPLDKPQPSFTKAHYLLALSGISAQEIELELGSLADHKPEVVTSQQKQVGLDNYLEAKKDENILLAIELSLVSAFNDFDLFINQNISIDWKSRRDELRKLFGVTSKSIATSATKKTKASEQVQWNQSLPGQYNILGPLKTKTSFPLRQLSRDKFEAHATVVYQLNEARLQNNFFPVCLSFEELNKASPDLKSKQVTDSWRVLADLTNEKFTKVSQEQKYFLLYQNSDKLFENTSEWHKLVITNSKRYLQEQFFNYMDVIYTKDDAKAKEYTPATNINKVSYFISKIITKNSPDAFIDKTLNVNGVPIWALIFYLLRGGLHQDALELVTRNRDVFNKFDKNFPVYLKKWVESETLPSELQVKLISEFNHQFQYINEDSADFDPYKYSVYKIIGKCELTKKSLPQSINLSIEDWLWFHLSIINEFSNESSVMFENYTLDNLQKKIISLGPKRFNSSSNNPLYLKLLILVGLFELAVQYTYEFINECDAVHLAIGLSYYGLLKVSSFNNKDELMIVNASDEFEINFSRLIGSYTRTFKTSDPKVASQYLILIAMSRGGKHADEIAKCHEALRELILVSRDFPLLLGELNPANGEKVPGILEKQRSLIDLGDLPRFYHQIIEISSKRCEEEGRIFDALHLYQLCQDYDTVVSLINKLVSEILATSELDKPLVQHGNYSADNAPDSIDNNIILLSEHIINMFNNNSFILERISPTNKRTNDLLLPIIKVRDAFVQKNYSQVISEIAALGLVPIDETQQLVDIRNSVDHLSRLLDDNIVRVIPSLLIMIMTSVTQLNSLTKRYFSENEQLARMKKIAKNTMIYAGMVQYKMPRETYSLLINLEAAL